MKIGKDNATTWTAREGTITFLLPDNSSYEFPATSIEHPLTMCQVLDTIVGLSSLERHAVLSMVSNVELRRLRLCRERG